MERSWNVLRIKRESGLVSILTTKELMTSLCRFEFVSDLLHMMDKAVVNSSTLSRSFHYVKSGSL